MWFCASLIGVVAWTIGTFLGVVTLGAFTHWYDGPMTVVMAWKVFGTGIVWFAVALPPSAAWMAFCIDRSTRT
jgi:hypothetical protein